MLLRHSVVQPCLCICFSDSMIIDHRKSNQEISFKLGLMILDHFWLTDLSSRVSCTWAFSEI